MEIVINGLKEELRKLNKNVKFVESTIDNYENELSNLKQEKVNNLESISQIEQAIKKLQN